MASGSPAGSGRLAPQAGYRYPVQFPLAATRSRGTCARWSGEVSGLGLKLTPGRALGAVRIGNYFELANLAVYGGLVLPRFGEGEKMRRAALAGWCFWRSMAVYCMVLRLSEE